MNHSIRDILKPLQKINVLLKQNGSLSIEERSKLEKIANAFEKETLESDYFITFFKEEWLMIEATINCFKAQISDERTEENKQRKKVIKLLKKIIKSIVINRPYTLEENKLLTNKINEFKIIDRSYNFFYAFFKSNESPLIDLTYDKVDAALNFIIKTKPDEINLNWLYKVLNRMCINSSKKKGINNSIDIEKLNNKLTVTSNTSNDNNLEERFINSLTPIEATVVDLKLDKKSDTEIKNVVKEKFNVGRNRFENTEKCLESKLIDFLNRH